MGADDVEIEGLDDVLRRFDTLPKIVITELTAAMERGAKRVIKMMKRLCPVDSGALRDSIGWTWGAAPKGAVVIGNVAPKGNIIGITIYAGGTEKTARRQARSSGTRARDQNRGSYFDSDNARYQEFGTSKMPAQPYFYPAWRAKKKGFKLGQTAAIRKACKQLFAD
jgi:HK97 gp10 family phage protein